MKDIIEIARLAAERVLALLFSDELALQQFRDGAIDRTDPERTLPRDRSARREALSLRSRVTRKTTIHRNRFRGQPAVEDAVRDDEIVFVHVMHLRIYNLICPLNR